MYTRNISSSSYYITPRHSRLDLSLKILTKKLCSTNCKSSTLSVKDSRYIVWVMKVAIRIFLLCTLRLYSAGKQDGKWPLIISGVSCVWNLKRARSLQTRVLLNIQFNCWFDNGTYALLVVRSCRHLEIEINACEVAWENGSNLTYKLLVLGHRSYSLIKNIKQTAVINILKTCILWTWRFVC